MGIAYYCERDKTGMISRFKAHLVEGFTQIPGPDFSFTFAPVARWDSSRSLLCLAAIDDFELRLDVKTAFQVYCVEVDLGWKI